MGNIVNHLNDSIFVKYKIAEYATKYCLGLFLDRFKELDTGQKASFVIYIMYNVRNDLYFGMPIPTDPQPPLSQLFMGVKYANCGIMCEAFALFMDELGIKHRLVQLQKKTDEDFSHIGIEVEIDGNWMYLDLLFRFTAYHHGKPYSAEELKSNLYYVYFWEEHFSSYYLRYGNRLSDYFYNIKVLE